MHAQQPCANAMRMSPRAGDREAASAADAAHMRRALDLARTALGQTHPNPAVGCVIVDPSGRVVGEGYHPRAGQAHAEVFALRAAGAAAAGSTAYVTLEPCNHYGRTPPCSRALVAAGVARVVVGVADPNPLVGGYGIKTLQDAGVQVVVGCEEAACHDINAEFMQRMQAEAAAAAAQLAAAAAGAASSSRQ
jgi:diaminohydroxyphosphoribosylaminopyrimidine deaminase/5-amino-6-(5-phosphoribosylamino)uracil reductase